MSSIATKHVVRSICGFVLATCVAMGTAHAAIVNGGFEDGLTGWTIFGPTPPNSVFDIGTDCPGSIEGDCYAQLGPSAVPGGIFQGLTNLLAGKQYTLSFAVNTTGTFSDPANSFVASLNGVNLLSLINPPSAPFQVYTFRQIATSATGEVRFTAFDPPGFFFLDAVVLQVPEPASLGLLGAGLVGMFLSRRRKPATI